MYESKHFLEGQPQSTKNFGSKGRMLTVNQVTENYSLFRIHTLP